MNAGSFSRRCQLYSRLVADETQLTYYDSGIGTYVAESNPITRVIQWVENTLDMAFAMLVKQSSHLYSLD